MSSSASFRVISSAAGLSATLSYKVTSNNAIASPACPAYGSCTEQDGKYDYGRAFASDGTRYVTDNLLGTQVTIDIVTGCPVGMYPGSATSVDIPASAGASASTSQQASCIACPKDTTTYGGALTKNDCKCNEGMVDTRPLIPAGYAVDETVSPCISQDLLCGTTSGGLSEPGCVTFRQGALLSINPGFWSYSATFAMDPGAVTWTSVLSNASVAVPTGVISDVKVRGLIGGLGQKDILATVCQY